MIVEKEKKKWDCNLFLVFMFIYLGKIEEFIRIIIVNEIKLIRCKMVCLSFMVVNFMFI